MMTATSDLPLTSDRFLDGKLELFQPASGSHRAGLDPIMLAAAVTAEPGEIIADLGAGIGTAGLALASRLPGIEVVLAEIDATLAALAAKNIDRNRLHDRARMVVVDITAAAAERTAAGLGRESFDQVILNPPFHAPDKTRPPAGAAKQRAYVLSAGLETWIRTAVSLLKPGGTLTLIHRADRLDDLLVLFQRRAGGIRIKPLHPRRNAPANRIIISARKGSRAPLSLLPGLILHEDDTNRYTAAADAVLRGGALPLGTR